MARDVATADQANSARWTSTLEVARKSRGIRGVRKILTVRECRSAIHRLVVSRQSKASIETKQLGHQPIDHMVWSAIEIRSAYGFIVGGQFASLPSEGFACSLQFDINTPADRTESLPSASLAQIFQELVSLATEIAATGDTP